MTAEDCWTDADLNPPAASGHYLVIRLRNPFMTSRFFDGESWHSGDRVLYWRFPLDYPSGYKQKLEACSENNGVATERAFNYAN